jgi:hypothetical protein
LFPNTRDGPVDPEPLARLTKQMADERALENDPRYRAGFKAGRRAGQLAAQHEIEQLRRERDNAVRALRSAWLAELDRLRSANGEGSNGAAPDDDDAEPDVEPTAAGTALE